MRAHARAPAVRQRAKTPAVNARASSRRGGGVKSSRSRIRTSAPLADIASCATLSAPGPKSQVRRSGCRRSAVAEDSHQRLARKHKSDASADGFPGGLRDSLSFGGLPEFDFVAFRVDDPCELAVLGVFRLLENVATLAAQSLQEAAQVRDSVIDHEGRLGGCKRVTFGAAHGPDGRARLGIARFVGPAEHGAAPVLYVDTQVLLVPSAQRNRIPGLEEDPADTCDSLHVRLRA